MVTGEVAQLEARCPGGAARDVVVLLPQGPYRSRLAAALQQAGHRVTVSGQVTTCTDNRHGSVLITGDTEGANRSRATFLAESPEATCLVLVEEPTPGRYRHLLANGMSALPADGPIEDVVVAVAATTRALACLPASAARTLAGSPGARPVLTERETCWLRALAGGETVAGLARTAGYSEREMYRLLRTLYGRLGTDTRTEALLRADRWGLLATPAGVSAGPCVPTQRGMVRR